MRLIEQFPSDSRFRYVLTRGWDGPALGVSYRRMAFVMLNPSTADEHRDDPTVRRCRSFAHDWGCDGIAIVNLFAYRTPSREALWSATGDVVGPENDRALLAVSRAAGQVVFAWGSDGARSDRARGVIELLALPSPVCLGITANGTAPPSAIHGTRRSGDSLSTGVAPKAVSP